MMALAWLLAMFVYLLIAFFVTRGVARLAARRGKLTGRVAAFLSIAVFVLIPTGDELLGLVVYHQLCETEAKLEVYGKMALPREFYSENGQPLFVSGSDSIDGFSRMPNDRGVEDRTDLYRYIFREYTGTQINVPVLIEKDRSCLSRKDNGQALMCETTFYWRGGWWKKIFFNGWFNPGYCSPRVNFYDLHDDIFYPESELSGKTNTGEKR